jgi:hypothetical protein
VNVSAVAIEFLNDLPSEYSSELGDSISEIRIKLIIIIQSVIAQANKSAEFKLPKVRIHQLALLRHSLLLKRGRTGANR